MPDMKNEIMRTFYTYAKLTRNGLEQKYRL